MPVLWGLRIPGEMYQVSRSHRLDQARHCRLVEKIHLVLMRHRRSVRSSGRHVHLEAIPNQVSHDMTADKATGSGE
jgi:ribosomal protein L18